MSKQLLKSLLVYGLALGAAVVGQTASADPSDVLRWQSVIGIIEANNVVGKGTGAMTGAPGPWSARSGHVKVDPDKARIDFDVEGLVFAGGNFIGTPGPVAQVKGTLICDTDGSASGGNSVFVDTPFVDLDDQGGARFSGNVSSIPSVCTTEPDVAFLIRVGSGKWIGNAAVLQ